MGVVRIVNVSKTKGNTLKKQKGKKSNKKKASPEEIKANMIMYMVQDMLDDMLECDVSLMKPSDLDLDNFEKEVLRVIKMNIDKDGNEVTK